MPLYRWHEQVETSKGILVDKELVPLLEALWASDYETQFSCQGGGRDPDVKVWVDPYIVFPTYEGACLFLKESVMALPSLHYQDCMWLHAFPSHPNHDWGLRAKVVWSHKLTEELTQLWQDRVSVSYTGTGCETS